MTHQQKTSPRAIYRLQETQRVQESASLATKFTKLKSLTVDLSFFDPEGLAKSSEIKYTVNLDHAKSVFRFACHNHECVAGDFDLSHVLAEAVADREDTIQGEIRCEGWRNKNTIGSVNCRNLLRYKLTLRY